MYKTDLSYRKVLLILLLLCWGLLLAGCDGDDVKLQVRAATESITGKVIDGVTRVSIGVAEIILFGNGLKRTTLSSNASDPDLGGTFTFSDVPGRTHQLRISAAGFAEFTLSGLDAAVPYIEWRRQQPALPTLMREIHGPSSEKILEGLYIGMKVWLREFNNAACKIKLSSPDSKTIIMQVEIEPHMQPNERTIRSFFTDFINHALWRIENVIFEDDIITILAKFFPKYEGLQEFLDYDPYIFTEPTYADMPEHYVVLPEYGLVLIDSNHRSFFPELLNSTMDLTVSDRSELIEQLQPLDSSVPFDAEQIQVAPGRFLIPPRNSVQANNLNADFGLQRMLRGLLLDIVAPKQDDGTRSPTFTIISHGHSIAALVPLSEMIDLERGTYLFETSIFLPLNGWTPESSRLMVGTIGAQLWSSQLSRLKKIKRERELHWQGGIAIALNGHRGRPCGGKGRAPYGNLTPEQLEKRVFGAPPEEFAARMRARGINRLVIITEHYRPSSLGSDDIYTLNIKSLSESSSRNFNSANKDLQSYAKRLYNHGFEVLVVSGDTRLRS